MVKLVFYYILNILKEKSSNIMKISISYLRWQGGFNILTLFNQIDTYYIPQVVIFKKRNRKKNVVLKSSKHPRGIIQCND